MSSILAEYLELFPIVDPIICFGVFAGIPVVSFLITQILVRCCFRHADRAFSLPATVSHYVNNNAVKVLLGGILLALLLVWNQAAIFYQKNVSIGFEIEYYLRVNSVEYDNSAAISLAATNSSYDTVISTLVNPSSVSRIGLGSNQNLNSSQDWRMRLISGRRLSSGNWITFAYHTSSWDNLLTPSRMSEICLTERNMVNRLSCLDKSASESIIPEMFDQETCQPIYISPTNFVSSNFASISSSYFQDNLDPISPSSAIIISYIRSGTCDSESGKCAEKQHN